LATLLGLSFALHLYIGVRLVTDMTGPVAGALLALVLVASAVLVPFGLMARRIARPPASDRLAWVGMPFFGLFSSLLVLTLLRDALLLAASPFGGVGGDLRAASAAAVPVIAAVVTLLGFANARRVAAAVQVRIALPGLPAAQEGFRIVQISDIHVGPTIKAPYLQRIVDEVNRLQPDVVAITGDLVDGGVPELRDHVAPLAQLRARHGSYFVTGNHEYYSGALPWLAELQRLGIRPLVNEHVVLDHGGAPLVLAGVTDYTAAHFEAAHKPDARAAMQGAPGSAVKVMLAHQPRSAPAAAEAGCDVQLSGHTHGGQFLPWNFFVRLQQPWTAGLHRVGAMWLYVSRGTGYWGPPKRFGAPSEITEVLLVRPPVG
jgi:uncharacterized protein